MKAADRTVRLRGKHQLDRLEANIRCYGVISPVLANKDGRIIDGHAVVEVAKRIPLATVPVCFIEHLNDAQERVCRIAVNKIQDLSVWNIPELKLEFEFISDIDIGLLAHTGFSTPEIDIILEPGAKTSGLTSADQVPDPVADIVSRRGDVWTFRGGHRILCADALAMANLSLLMAGEQARLVICDPPYNVRIRGHVSGRASMREFAMASGEMSREQFTTFLLALFRNCAAASVDGALNLHFMDWRHIDEMMAAGRDAYDELKNVCVWAKDNAGMGSLWRSQHELCFAWKKGDGAHVNNVELGRHGRNRSNVWEYPGVPVAIAGLR